MVHWAIWAGIAYVLICWVMPLAAKMFPSLEPIAAAAHAIISPLMAKAKAEAEHLAQDASAALHHTVQLIEAKAPGILADAKTLSDAWITEADGTRQRFDAAPAQGERPLTSPMIRSSQTAPRPMPPPCPVG